MYGTGLTIEEMHTQECRLAPHLPASDSRSMDSLARVEDKHGPSSCNVLHTSFFSIWLSSPLPAACGDNVAFVAK